MVIEIALVSKQGGISEFVMTLQNIQLFTILGQILYKSNIDYVYRLQGQKTWLNGTKTMRTLNNLKV